MTIVRMFVSHPYLVGSPEAVALVATIEADMSRHFGGFTVSMARGVWIGPDGVRHVDVVDVYDIMVNDTTSTLVMGVFAERFAQAYGQESIPYAIMRSENHFIEVEEKEVDKGAKHRVGGALNPHSPEFESYVPR